MSFFSIWNELKKLIKFYVYLYLRLLNNLFRKRIMVELVNFFIIKDIVFDIVFIIVIDFVFINIINS